MRIVFFTIQFCALLCLFACTPEPSPPLRVGTNLWVGYEPLYLARDIGVLQTRSVKLVEYPNATEVMRGFRNGVLEAAALTLDEVLLLLQTGTPLKIILVTDISDGADAIIAAKSVAGMRDLKGLRVGVENTALGAYMLSRALQLNGLQPEDIELVPLGSHQHEEAFLEGRIDAVVTFEPVRSRLLAAGGHEVFDSSMLPSEIFDVVIVREEVLHSHRDQIDELLQGWFAALAYTKSNPQQAVESMARRENISVQAFFGSLDGIHVPSREENLRMLGGVQPVLHGTMDKLMTVMLAQELLRAPMDVTQMFESAPLLRVAP